MSVHAQPGAKKDAVSGLYGDKLKVTLAAPPVDGKANAKLCAFLAKELGTAKSAVTLIAGDTSREKRVHIADVTAEWVAGKLMPADG